MSQLSRKITFEICTIYVCRKWVKIAHGSAVFLIFFDRAQMIGRKKQSLDLPDPFQARRLPIVSAKSDFASCRCHPRPAKKIRVDAEKPSDLKLQTWATYSSYVGQVHVRVRIRVRVNTKKQKISTYLGTRRSTSLL